MTRHSLSLLSTTLALVSAVHTPLLADTIAVQSFENSGDTWAYTPNPPEFHDPTALWGETNTLSTLVPTDGQRFWGIRDLNSVNGTSGFGMLTFLPVDLTGYSSALLAFDFEVIGFDLDDDIKYEVAFDGVGQGEVVIVDGGSSLTTNGTVHIEIPDTVSAVSLVVAVRQDATTDYGLLDHVRVEGTLTGVVTPAVTVTVTNAFDFMLDWPDDAFATEYRVDVSTNQVFCSDLLLSEYIEGAEGNEKAIEIFNGTGAPVDLSNYGIWRISNGGDWPEASLPLAGVLNDGDVHVVVHPSASFSNLTSAADVLNAIVNHNGNDALGLARKIAETWTLIDAVGEDGSDPGAGWAVAGTANATADHILRRKKEVDAPTTNWTVSAGATPANSQWLVLDPTEENCAEFGRHDGPEPDYIPGYDDRPTSQSCIQVMAPKSSTTYFYRVRSIAADGSCASSRTGSVTTLAPPSPTVILFR